MSVRAVRNCNPGNLNRGQPWQGLASPDEMTPEQAQETRFAVFKSPKWGFRAMAILLHNYERMYGLSTVRDIIRRWAPPFENNTGAYVEAIAKALSVAQDTKINLSDHIIMRSLCKAIATHECGGWFFTEDDLDAGVSMALGG